MATKKCSKCKQEKDLNEFWKDSDAKDGCRKYCKQCEKELGTQYRQDNYLRTKVLNIISRAKAESIPYDSFENLYNYLEPIYELGKCEKCGRKLEHGVGKSKQDSPSPSIDQICPTGGYVLGNIALLCNKCNGAKSENTYEDLINWILWYEMKKNIEPSAINK